MALERYEEEDVVQQTTHKVNINSHNFIKLMLCTYVAPHTFQTTFTIIVLSVRCLVTLNAY